MNQEKRKKITIYTDGACSGNPGPGGWGAVLLYGSHRKELSGFVPDTTNNKMELLAAVEALRALKVPCQVELYSDSAYLINAWKQGWLANWQKKRLEKREKTAGGKSGVVARIVAIGTDSSGELDKGKRP